MNMNLIEIANKLNTEAEALIGYSLHLYRLKLSWSIMLKKRIYGRIMKMMI